MVTQGKIKDRISDENWHVYALKLEMDKFYVGIAVNPQMRLATHLTQSKDASSWCKKYKPIEIIETFDTGLKAMKDACIIEDITTLKYIQKYGYENVRGGRYLGHNKTVSRSYNSHSKKGHISITHRLFENFDILYSELADLKLYEFIVDPKRKLYITNLVQLSIIKGLDKTTMLEELIIARDKFQSFKSKS